MIPLSEAGYTVAPGWWDPKDRTFIFNPGTVVCGVLFAGGGHLIFAGPEGIGFQSPIDRLGVTWVKLGSACRLRTPVGNRLVYLLPPVDGVDRLSRDTMRSIAGHLTTSSDVAGLVDRACDLGDLGDLLEYVGLLGGALTAVSHIAAMRQAKRSRKALETHFTHQIGR